MTKLNVIIYSKYFQSIKNEFPSYKTTDLNSLLKESDIISFHCKPNSDGSPIIGSKELEKMKNSALIINTARGNLISEKDLNNPETGPLLKKYLKGVNEVDTEHRMRILRLIENMTLGRNAVAYLTESLHGAGSPQAQRVQISRRVDIEEKKSFAIFPAKLALLIINETLAIKVLLSE